MTCQREAQVISLYPDTTANRFKETLADDLNIVEQSAVIDLARAILKQQLHRDVVISSASQAKDYFRMELCNLKNEVFGVMFLDSQRRLICYENLFYGTIDECSVYPRVVIQRVIECNAESVIFGHNHPSGTIKASRADESITARLKKALNLIDVSVLDHIIVGYKSEEVLSFTEEGLM